MSSSNSTEGSTDSEATTTGSGTESDPYVLTTVAELQAIQDEPDAYYELGSDINASGTGFQPISGFSGTLDGKGYEVTDLTIDTSNDEVGLFATIQSSGTVKAVRLVGATVTGSGTVGTLAGTNLGTVEDVGATETTVHGDSNKVGGLVGQNEGTVTLSFAAGTVESTYTASSGSVGGLVGRHASGEISESLATTAVEAPDAGDVGGLVGHSYALVQDSYATGDVLGDQVVGGLVGENDGTVERSFAAGIVGGNDHGGFTAQSSTETDCYWDETASGLGVTAGGASGRTTAEMQGNDADGNLSGLDFQSTWATVGDDYPVLQGIDQGEQLDARPEQREPRTAIHEVMDGDGSAADPYVVTGPQELQSMSQDVIAFYELGTDVDAAGTDFQPVEAFRGHLDGQGFEITHLTVDTTADEVGLVAQLSGSGTVENVRIVDGSVSGGSRVGALIGYNLGHVENVGTSETTVHGDHGDVGGLVGENHGPVVRSFAAGTVESDYSSSNGEIGGLVGHHRNDEIRKSFATATVKAPEGGEVGGLVGENDATILDAYATGDVVGGSTVGGLVGHNDGTVERAFATGIVGGNTVGGFTADASSETDCFWDLTATGLDDTSGNAFGLETHQMQGPEAELNLLGFQFDTTWATVGGDYPVLQDLDESEQLAVRQDVRQAPTVIHQEMEGDGSANDPYVVTSAQELQAMTQDSIAFYELGSDISLGSSNFQPIESFGGHLDGQIHQITDLAVDTADSDVGLFDTILESGTVESLRLVGSSVTGSYRVGALAATNRGHLRGVVVNLVSIETDSGSAGGVVAENHGTIDRTFVTGTLQSASTSSNAEIGGLVGHNRNGQIKESFSRVEVSVPDGGEVGGFVGENDAKIQDCFATGDVTGASNVGGFVGHNDDTIETSFAAGSVEGDSVVGGFSGSASTENDCYWDETASGQSETGGSAVGLDTNQMQGDDSAHHLLGFDFQNTWMSVDGDYATFQPAGDVTVATVAQKTVAVGGEITLELATENASKVTVQKLWTDWDTGDDAADGADFVDQVAGTGKANFQWDAIQPTAAPVISVSFPSRYVGGDYEIEIEATNFDGDSDTDSTLITIE